MSVMPDRGQFQHWPDDTWLAVASCTYKHFRDQALKVLQSQPEAEALWTLLVEAEVANGLGPPGPYVTAIYEALLQHTALKEQEGK